MNRVFKSVTLIVAFVGISGCGANKAIDATKEMPDKMDRMYDQMQKTNDMIERQPVVIPFEAMLKEEYGRDLVPIPFDLIPFAREFAKYAGDEELAEVVYIWIKKLNEMTLNLPNPTPEQVEAFNHRKLHVYSALQAVCGFIPQSKLAGIIKQQIFGAGRYQESVLQMLMLRVQFLRDVMLEASLFGEGLTNVGKVERAVEYADQIEYVARLPFASEIAVNVTGFLQPIGDVRETMSPTVAPTLWRKLKTKADRLVLQQKQITGEPGEDQRLYLERQERLQKSLSFINGRLGAW
jgi:hypothetical protein